MLSYAANKANRMRNSGLYEDMVKKEDAFMRMLDALCEDEVGSRVPRDRRRAFLPTDAAGLKKLGRALGIETVVVTDGQ